MDIKGYVIIIIGVSVIGSVISLIAPSEQDGLGRHVKLAVALVMISVCISPIKGVIELIRDLEIEDIAPDGGEDDKKEYESIFNESYYSYEVGNLKEGIKKILYENFEIENEDCSVDVIFEGEGEERHLKRIFITLSGPAVWKDTGKIEKYLRDLLSCEVVSAID